MRLSTGIVFCTEAMKASHLKQFLESGFLPCYENDSLTKLLSLTLPHSSRKILKCEYLHKVAFLLIILCKKRNQIAEDTIKALYR